MRVPRSRTWRSVRLINGPEAFTPDGEFILGPTDVRGLWIGGRLLRPRPRGRRRDGQARRGVDPRGHAEPRRLGDGLAPLRRRLPQPRVHARAHDRGVRDLLRRQVPRSRAAGRAAAARLPHVRAAQELGAAFGEKSGWERANWFEPNAAAGDESLRPRGWAGKLWSPAIGAEHRACREAAALFDETSFAKIEVAGDGAADLLEHLCDNRVARDVGAITYTQMLNARGGIECDFTVTRLAEDRFRIVTGTAFGRHDLAWIRSHAPDDGSVASRTSPRSYACLGLWGPKAREILQPLCVEPLDFPYMRARELAVGPVPCLALRVTYVGELGWELYCPIGVRAAPLGRALGGGREHGLVAGGYKAIDSLRLEKGYRVWGADISPEDTPYEAGLGFAVKLDKEFLGRDALARRARAEAQARVPRPRRPPLGRARLRAGPGRRRDRRSGHERRLRLHGRALDRVRLRAGRECRAGHAGRGRDLRRVGRRRGRGRAALRPGRRPHPRLPAVAPRLLDERREERCVLSLLGVPEHPEREALLRAPRPPPACRPRRRPPRPGPRRPGRSPGGGATSRARGRRAARRAGCPRSPSTSWSAKTPGVCLCFSSPTTSGRCWTMSPPRATLKHLRAAADGEHGHVALERRGEERELAAVALGRARRSSPDAGRARTRPGRCRSRPEKSTPSSASSVSSIPSSLGGTSSARPPARSIACTYASGMTAAGTSQTPQRTSGSAYAVMPMTGRTRQPKRRGGTIRLQRRRAGGLPAAPRPRVPTLRQNLHQFRARRPASCSLRDDRRVGLPARTGAELSRLRSESPERAAATRARRTAPARST